MRAMLVAAIAALMVGCAGSRFAAERTAALPDRTSCDTEARLLVQAAEVYTAPEGNWPPKTRLARGHFVYRCEQRGEWLGVMYPADGEHVDCFQRSAGKECSLGWIRKSVQMEVLG